jgi:phosphoribosylamine--glycine ligase
MSNGMKVLVVGSGGREHALVHSLRASPEVSEVFCAPGNGGISTEATCVSIAPEKTLELARFAEELKVDLTVVGPELPLSLGIVDMFRRKGLRVFGPTADAAQLESSKVFAKLFMERNKIPTAPFRICASYREALDVIEGGEFGYPVVLKADGLAAGKGVLIAKERKAAVQAARELMVERKFGPAGDRIVIEKFLTGIEVSFMVISDGIRFLPLVPSCDYKKAYDGDLGPNTGGMGAYAPSVNIDRTTYLKILTKVVGPAIGGMIEEGRPFQGVLYGGLILNGDGITVLEFNVRFGDPETQVVLPILGGDLFSILFDAASGQMMGVPPLKPKGCTVTVVVAAGGYPGPYNKGMLIEGLERAGSIDGVTVFHAGTRKEGDRFVTTGGRVLNVTAVAPKLPRAIYLAYQAAEMICFEGSRYRLDIAHNAVFSRESLEAEGRA